HTPTSLSLLSHRHHAPPSLPSFPTRRSSDLLPTEHGPIPAGGTPDRAAPWPHPADPDRHPGTLNRRGLEDDFAHSEVAAGERKRLPGPETGDDPQRFVQQLGAAAQLRLLAERREAQLGIAYAHPENGAAAAQAVDGGHLARHVPRSPASKRGDRRPKANACGHDRGSGQYGPGIRGRYAVDRL